MTWVRGTWIFALVLLNFNIGVPAWAQEFGALMGVHYTSVEANNPAASESGKTNYKAGLLVTFDLMKDLKFRSGLLYNQRHVDLTYTAFPTLVYNYNLEYLDVPADVQYNVSDIFGIFGGLTFAMNISSNVGRPAAGGPTPTVDPVRLMALLDLGLALTFDKFGVDLYYQRGLGRIIDKFENFGSYGANFIYWF